MDANWRDSSARFILGETVAAGCLTGIYFPAKPLAILSTPPLVSSRLATPRRLAKVSIVSDLVDIPIGLEIEQPICIPRQRFQERAEKPLEYTCGIYFCSPRFGTAERFTSGGLGELRTGSHSNLHTMLLRWYFLISVDCARNCIRLLGRIAVVAPTNENFVTRGRSFHFRVA